MPLAWKPGGNTVNNTTNESITNVTNNYYKTVRIVRIYGRKEWDMITQWLVDWAFHFVSSLFLGVLGFLLTWIILCTFYSMVSQSPWRIVYGNPVDFYIFLCSFLAGVFFSLLAHCWRDGLLVIDRSN